MYELIAGQPLLHVAGLSGYQARLASLHTMDLQVFFFFFFFPSLQPAGPKGRMQSCCAEACHLWGLSNQPTQILIFCV